MTDEQAQTGLCSREKETRTRINPNMAQAENTELIDNFEDLYRKYYEQDIYTLAEHFPNEQRSLRIDYEDLYRHDADLADDYRAQPNQIREYAEEALRLYDIPIDVDLAQAHVRVYNLPDDHTFYPGEFSPTEQAGDGISIRGDIARATDVYSKIEEAAFECQRCGSLTYIPQSDDADFQEPHECMGCERQGPFKINFDQSDFIDGQQLRIQTPPEVASGAGQDIDAFLLDDLPDVATTGDRVTITGSVHLEQQSSGREKTAKFHPYIDAHSLEVDESDHTDLDITKEERQRIQGLASGEEGKPLEIAADSLSTKVYGYQLIKRMLILAMVGGQKVEYQNGDHDRGEFHVLLLGDPGTAKSKLIERVEELGWRTVGMSGKGATVAGTTATATQDDFGPAEWTLDAGAFVKANGGVVCIDELDDMPEEVRAAMLEPMSRQSIHVNKGGINADLTTETAVVAAGNPKYGRFDPYEPVHQQFDLGSTLLSRFDLIFTLTDRPDPEKDAKISGHILESRDAAKRQMRGEATPGEEDVVSPPVEGDILRKWIALAKQQDAPVFADESVREWLEESFHNLRGVHGYDEEATVPVTFRKLEGIIRIAEAAAKFEFSDTIEMRHAREATQAVGESMQDYGKNEDGELDAGVQEAGTSKSQADRMKVFEKVIQEIQPEKGGVPEEELVAELEDRGISGNEAWGDIDRVKDKGWAYNPDKDELRWIGRA